MYANTSSQGIFSLTGSRKTEYMQLHFIEEIPIQGAGTIDILTFVQVNYIPATCSVRLII